MASRWWCFERCDLIQSRMQCHVIVKLQAIQRQLRQVGLFLRQQQRQSTLQVGNAQVVLGYWWI